MEHVGDLFQNVPAGARDELFQTLLTAPGLRIERIVSHGHNSPDGFWYDSDTHEWVVLVEGAARIRLEGLAPVELTAGSYLHIPAHRRHRVEWTSHDEPTIWLAVHYVDHRPGVAE